jgi:methylthioribose-1-phosphate isomerase
VPFYAAVPSPTIDWEITDAMREIPIEERDSEELLLVRGQAAGEEIAQVRIAAEGTVAANPAFDVTPARLVTALITDLGIAAATRKGLDKLYHRKVA